MVVLVCVSCSGAKRGWLGLFATGVRLHDGIDCVVWCVYRRSKSGDAGLQTRARGWKCWCV